MDIDWRGAPEEEEEEEDATPRRTSSKSLRARSEARLARRSESLRAVADEEETSPRAPPPPPLARHTRLLVVERGAAPQLEALERAARDDVLVVRTADGAKGADVVAAVAAAHRAAGSPALRSAALWQAGVPEELEDDAGDHDDDDDSPEAEQRAQYARDARRKALRTCRRVVKGVAPLLTAGGRIHVLSPGLLPPGPPHLAEDEAATAADLEGAAGGRTLALCRGVPLAEDTVLLSPDGEAVNIDAAYFDARGLKMWRFARNRHISVKLTGIDPHRRKVGRIEDAGDVQQSVLTYLKEIPMLYSIMVGSFLSIFVPEHCTSYVATCSEKGNTGASSSLGAAVLVFNCLTAAAFVVSGGFVNRRETWLIEWLDADDEYPPTHLRHVIDAYPRIKAALRSHNVHCLTATRVTACAVLVNFLLSACYLLRNIAHAEKECCPGIMPGATKTVSALLTNTLLIIIRLIHRMRTTAQSLRNTAGVSSVHDRPLIYNVIDADHVGDKEDGDGSDGEGEEMMKDGAALGALGGLACCACAARDDDA